MRIWTVISSKRIRPVAAWSASRSRPPKGPAKPVGRGLFTEALLQRFPQLPVEEEGRLCDPRLRENWVERVFAYHAMKGLWISRWKLADLIEFHTRYKLLLRSHCETEYRQLGQLVAKAKALTRSQLRSEYQTRFMRAMTKIATTRKHANVLQHILGFFKKQIG